MARIQFIFWMLLLFPVSGRAEQSQFIGKWCTNPCFYETVSRPWNLPCGIEITENEIKWEHHTFDDKSKTRRFALEYRLLEKREGEEVLLVNGGGKHEWYSHESSPGAKHKITLSVNHSNNFAVGNPLLTDEPYCEDKKPCHGGGSVFIRRTSGPCP